MIAQVPSIGSTVREIIGHRINRDPLALALTDNLRADLGVTDFDFVEIGMDVEDKWDFEATDAELEACRTVADLVELVKRHTQAEAA